MKKLTVMCLVLTMLITTVPSNVHAFDSKQKDSTKDLTEVVQIMAKDSIQHIDGSYTVKDTVLIGTALEGENVVVKSDGVYINGARGYTVEIDVTGIVIAFLVDGAIFYATGYSGAYFSSVAINAILTFAAAHPVGTLIILISLLALTSSSVNSYKTNTGNTCYYRQQSHTYICAWSGGI